MKETTKTTTILVAVVLLLTGIGNGSFESNTAAQAGREPVIALPMARYATANESSSRNVVVSIDSEGEFYVGRTRVPSEKLAVTIRDVMLDKPPQEEIYIRCGVANQFSTVRELLNVIRQVGYERLSLIVNGSERSRPMAIKALIITPNGVKVDPRDVITLPPTPSRNQTK